MIVTFTDDVDLTGRGKRVHHINLVAAAAASVVNLRRGAVGGAIIEQIPLAANEKFLFSWPNPEYVSEGVFVEVTVAIAFGSIHIH